MKLIISCLSFLILFTSVTVYGQTKINSDLNFEVKFNYKNKKVPDSIMIWMSPNALEWGPINTYTAKKKQENTFLFTIPGSKVPQLLHFYYAEKGREKMIGTYYAESKDNIKMDLFDNSNKDSITFNGLGSEKYRLSEEFTKEFNGYYNPNVPKQLRKDASVEELLIFLDELTLFTRKRKQYKKELMESYRSKVSPEIFKLIDYEYANYDMYWQGNIYSTNYSYNDNPVFKKAIKDYFNNHYNELLDSTDDDISILSPSHYTMLMALIKANVNMNNEKKTEGDVIQYYNLMKSYSVTPKIRERLLIQFLKSSKSLLGFVPVSQVVYDSLIVDASKYINSNVGKIFVLEKTKYANGKKFFDASFIDLKGNFFNTSSLRGKVFMIDFWGRGCVGCAHFHQFFEKNVWPEFKNNIEFKYVSASINNKTEWIEDFNKGIYSSDEYLNVYTGKEGWRSHPFVKYYEVNAFPFILLVDKNGNIIAKIDNDSKKDANYLRGLIVAALKKPYLNN